MGIPGQLPCAAVIYIITNCRALSVTSNKRAWLQAYKYQFKKHAIPADERPGPVFWNA
jgi:hypothetical protein